MVSVPRNAKKILEGIKEYKKNSHKGDSINIKESMVTNRIFWLNTKNGVPLYSYAPIKHYEEIYEKTLLERDGIGRHIYQNGDKNWIYVPSPIPEESWGTTYNNERVNNVNHLSGTLESLNCGGNCSIDTNGISQLKKLIVLKCAENRKIHNISDASNFIDTIEKLDCSFNNYIYQKDIEKMKNLRILRCSGNISINNVNHLRGTLKTLWCAMNSEINQEGISCLTNLKNLNCKGNPSIYDVNHIVSLEKLICDSDSGIDQNGISRLKNIKFLSCNGNSKIYNVNHLKNTLEKLDCQFVSAVNKEGISELSNTVVFDTFCNPNFHSIQWL